MGYLSAWSAIDPLPPQPGLLRKSVAGERSMVMRVEIEAGTEIEEHSHQSEQFTIILSGHMTFWIGGGASGVRLEAGPGEILHVPSDCPHRAYAHDHVVELDVFSPVRPELTSRGSSA